MSLVNEVETESSREKAILIYFHDMKTGNNFMKRDKNCKKQFAARTVSTQHHPA